MKLHELFEAAVSPYQKMYDILESDYSDMLNAYRKTGIVLFRGSKEAGGFIEKSIRQDRKPVEMDFKVHDMLDASFKRLGLKATRTNSIFCSTSYSVAETWGSPFVIFVKNGWAATVFESTKKDYSYYDLSDIGRYTIDAKRSLDQLDADVKKLSPINIDTVNGLEKVLYTEYEDIIITGEKWIGIKVGKPNSIERKRLMNILEDLGIYTENI